MKKSLVLTLMTILAFFSIGISAKGADTLYRTDAKKEKGFNYPYYLFIPKNVETRTSLLVVPNNTGSINDTLSVHEKEARNLAVRYGIGYRLALELKTPLLVPVFPRPANQWRIYTHALDRDAMLIENGDMKRIDLQLVAMIIDAKQKLDSLGIKVDEKVLLNGFSASGSFVNRFAMLHPEIVKAVACGGINGICILPYSELNGVKLEFPLGIYDIQTLTGRKYNEAEYRKMPQYIYMGEKDDNDASLFRDGYSEEESNIIYTVLAKKMMPDRLDACKRLYLKAGINAEFKIYEGLGHKVNKDIFLDLVKFFNSASK